MFSSHLLTRVLPAGIGDDDDGGGQTLWKAWSTLAGVGAGIATRKLIQRAWTSRTGEAPPSNPADPAVAWSQALAWSAGLGVGVGVARTLAQRGAARAWTRATGETPPGLAKAATGRSS